MALANCIAAQVVDHLQDMKVPSSVIDKVAHENYARVLKAALEVPVS